MVGVFIVTLLLLFAGVSCLCLLERFSVASGCYVCLLVCCVNSVVHSSDNRRLCFCALLGFVCDDCVRTLLIVTWWWFVCGCFGGFANLLWFCELRVLWCLVLVFAVAGLALIVCLCVWFFVCCGWVWCLWFNIAIVAGFVVIGVRGFNCLVFGFGC